VQRSDLKLVLPLAAVFAVFFVAPLFVLVAMSLSSVAGLHAPTLSHYARFFTDSFNYSILWGTIVLGVKATLLCLLFGYPIAWIASRAKARWQTVLVFLVILPIMTSVVVRTFSWIVILGRQGVLNQIAMGLGITSEPL
jgi:putative spermidine/putrescine transport system permease protein